MFVHVFIWIWVLNWIYDALLSETQPSLWLTSAVSPGFGPSFSSHSPSAPLILSKSHYNPTNPTASHQDCLLSGSPALHIRIWNWAEGSFSPPLPSMWKLILSCQRAVSSSLSLNALEGWPAGLRDTVLGKVGGNSVTGSARGGCFYWSLGSPLFLLLSSLMCYYRKNTQKWRKITDAFLTVQPGGQEKWWEEKYG